MVDQRLVNHIQSRLAQGQTQTEITESLIKTGWSKEAVDEVFSILSNRVSDSPIITQNPTAQVKEINSGKKGDRHIYSLKYVS